MPMGDPTPYTAKDLRKVAAELAALSGQLSAVADQLGDLQFTAFGLGRLSDGVNSLHAFAHRAEVALRRVLRSGASELPDAASESIALREHQRTRKAANKTPQVSKK